MKTLVKGCALLLAGSFFVSACDQAAVAPEESADARVEESGTIIPGRYIVVLNPAAVAGKTALAVVEEVVSSVAAEPVYRYGSTIAGFAANLNGVALEALRNDPRVSYIEPDRVITLPPISIQDHGDVGIEAKPGGGGGSASQSTPWGITRVGGAGDGSGKTAWIIDSGIDLDHPDLNVDLGRSRSFLSTSTTPDDQHGHGTHVAGTVAARNNTSGVVGVAAGASVVAVRVLDRRGSGSYTGVIAGVDYVAANGSPGDVANMSLGGPVSQALDAAVVNAATNSGVRFVLAAGNESDHANNHSPARADGTGVYTISAFDSADRFASFSNFGNPPVDFGAPGVSVLSLYKGGGTATMSGTSMASPHAAGILLLGSIRSGGVVTGDPDGNADTIAIR